MCKYNNPYYWEDVLLKKRNLWRDDFAEIKSPHDAIFINTAVIDYERDVIDNNWACYPDAKSLLGFIQYVYIPLAFFYIINITNQDLYIPICSHSEMLEYINDSGSEYGDVMKTSLDELNTYWELDSVSCLEKLREFSNKFNSFWYHENSIFHLGIFGSTFEIADYLIHTTEFGEVLEEYIGLTTIQLKDICENFYTDRFSKRSFVHILNNNIGCII